jgi:predicted nucleic acid-binding protein
MLTDTTFWVDLLEERADGAEGPAHDFLARNRSHALRVSLVTWGELAAGVETSRELFELLNRIRILPLPLHVAWEASRIDRELTRSGQRLGENDNWIAGTARAWGLRLVSRDAAFRRVPRLRVVQY